jgi:putative oxidoreductase
MTDLGKLILRLALGVLILLHGIAKLRGGVDPIAGMVTGIGLPSFVTYGVYVGEVIAPVLVILGWYASIGAALIAVNMLFAIGLAHRADLLALGASGGWALELQGLYLAIAVAVALIGPGRYSLNGR